MHVAGLLHTPCATEVRVDVEFDVNGEVTCALCLSHRIACPVLSWLRTEVGAVRNSSEGARAMSSLVSSPRVRRSPVAKLRSLEPGPGALLKRPGLLKADEDLKRH